MKTKKRAPKSTGYYWLKHPDGKLVIVEMFFDKEGKLAFWWHGNERKQYPEDHPNLRWGKRVNPNPDFLSSRQVENERLKVLVDDLQDLAIWMTGCGYDFAALPYFVKNRHLLTKEVKDG